MKAIAPIFYRVWDSPTLTTWANRSTKSLRFLLVTPLLVTSFDTVEIAAWYLFASLTFFGTVIHDRVTLTFNRMIAFAMAGARDLSEISNLKKPRGDGSPDWDVVKRSYGAIGLLTLVTAALAGISGFALGAFSLNSILEGYANPENIWLALFIMLGGQVFSMCFSQYMVTIQGMGLVALSNRWSCLFSLLSVFAGFVTLSLDGDIVALSATMQSVTLLNVLRMKLLVGAVHKGALKGVPSIHFDRQIISWAWPAFWKGLFLTITNKGVIQMGAVIYARYGSVEAVAAYLFSFNLLRTVSSFAEAPLISFGPRLSQLMAKGEKERLGELYSKKATQAQWLFIAGAFCVGTFVPLGLEYIGSNTMFLTPLEWGALSVLFILQRYSFVGLRLPAIGNRVIYVKESALAGAISLAAMAPMTIYFGSYGLIATMYLPTILLLNIGPFSQSAQMLEVSTSRFLLKTGGVAIAVYVLFEIGHAYFLSR